MNDTLRDVTRWADRGDRIAIAMVVGAVRSAPRPLGTKMAINDRGEISGSVSGGCVEGAVVEIAERVIGSGHPELAHFGIADSEAWGVGLPCGGEVDVWVQAYEPGPFEDAARSGARAAEVTLLAGPQAGARLVITPDGGRFGSLGSAEADAEAAAVASELLWTDVSTRRGDLFIDVVRPAPRLLPRRRGRYRRDALHHGQGDGLAAVCDRPRATAAGGCAPEPTRTAGARAAIDEQVWERTMNRLRRIILLLSVALAAVIARMVIDGPKLLGGLTGALIVVLLLCSLALTRQGVRLQPGASSETERVDAR
jgi:xanthine/CO dehydrogenase XdhC/CoxF family maturation factor